MKNSFSRFICPILAVCVCATGAAAAGDIVFENAKMRLVLGRDACAKSLLVKKTGEEMLVPGGRVPFFSVTQPRPYNNEIKLHHPNVETTYPANRLRREGTRLTIGFETAPYEAVVDVKNSDDGYIAFTLSHFNVKRGVHYDAWYTMDLPPAEVFRVAQLSVRSRTNFGEWLGVMWDETAACSVMALDPYADVRQKACPGGRLLSADLVKGMRLKGGAAAVVAGAGGQDYLESVDAVERDYGLPRGVRSRRSDRLNASIFRTWTITPENADEQIAVAKRGGFRMMLIYYPALFGNHEISYLKMGDYEYNPEYPNGAADVRKLLDRIRAAGITPGFHTLHTHIGMKSRYVTPVADPRLNKSRRFTLAAPIAIAGPVSEISVFENPVDTVMHPEARVLQFGGELFRYERYTETPPYRFLGVRRGAFGTRAEAHPRGQVGGTLDMSEYGAKSCYIDQRTDLQDEIAAKIAEVCDAGMEFVYFDGAEGVNPPCGINVSLAQYRVVSRFRNPPLFSEGAAKSHFSWHLQAGANAFDTFASEVFKEKIIQFPFAEAPAMRKDFTRVDFGWWGIYLPGVRKDGSKTIGTQPDMWEFGTSKAASWDCPATVNFSPASYRHPRLDDLLEVMRRWEEVRTNGFLTAERKLMLRDPEREFHLRSDGKGGYDLVEWRQAAVGGSFDGPVRAFVYGWNGRSVLVCWHVSGEADIEIDGVGRLHVAGMKEIETDLATEDLFRALRNVRIVKGDE